MSGELLSVAEISEADRLAVEAGVPSLTLMENAGRAVADLVWARYLPPFVLVLCGPGNNGGDGFVAARLLRARGCDVRVALLGSVEALRGDAAEMAKQWNGVIEPLTPELIRRKAIIVDALFGAGLSRPLEGVARDVVRIVNKTNFPIVAVDVPSGISGDTGAPLDGKDGVCISARYTMTFFRKKPGHLLLPGRVACGEMKVADIGIPNSVLGAIKPKTFENAPDLWRREYPWPQVDGHKYSRGHAVIVSGPAHATGAARMAARAALRVGAGLVSVASPPDAVAINAAHLTAIMVKPFDGATGLFALLADKRLNAVVAGPGCGVGEGTRALVSAVLKSGAAAVLDADALTSFADKPQDLFAQLSSEIILTPHEGEFERLFPGLLGRSASKLEAAREGARIAGCIVLLKGADTVVASADGRASINANAPPWLATAGAGDVLAGFIGGLRAQGLGAFAAASAAVWLQGASASAFGPGLIAEDLPEMLPKLLKGLKSG